MITPFWSCIALLLATPVLPAQMAKGKAKFVGNVLSVPQPDPDFATYWNQVTPEDHGKWGAVEPARGNMDWSSLDAMYRYARERHFPFKEHTFIWGARQPPWIRRLSPEEQRAAVEKWIGEYGRRYPGTQCIDVVNEPLHDPPPYKEALGGNGGTGWDWVSWAFAAARHACPRAKLLLNEYGILENEADLERYITIVQVLKRRNLIDGLGVQAHKLETMNVVTVRASLNRLAGLNLPIYISELDVNLADDAAQKERYELLFPIFWEHPAVAGITLWGYKQKYTWNRQAYLLRADGTERPALVWLKAYLGRSPGLKRKR